jgi:pimeloyl-ACP methyl ester carboxylesterase
LADDAFAVIASLEIERYVLIGHSMGGKLAQYIASTRPKGLEGLVLVAPAPPNPQILPPEAFEIQKHAYDCAENVAGAIDFLTQTQLSPALRQQVIEDSLRGSSTAKYGWPNLMQFEDISREVAGIQVPTLILAGEDDRERSLAQQRSEVLARIPGAQLIALPNAGHLLPLELSDQVAAAIRTFLQ